MEMVTNTPGSMVTIDGDNVNNVDTLILITQVAHLNTKEFLAPGKRKVKMVTRVVCGAGSQLQVPLATSNVIVLPMPQPIIDIRALTTCITDYE